VSKMHGLNDLTGIPDDSADAGYAAAAQYQAAGTLAPFAAFLAPVAPTQTLYLTEAGTAGAINLNDIHQGQIGDCFLLSSIGEIAMLKPGFISGMIHAGDNGTETVTLYEGTNGRPVTSITNALKAVSETVTNVFPTYAVNNGAGQDVQGNLKEIWPQVLENAVATLGGGYASIAYGGSPVLAMETLTGHAASYMSPASLSFATLQGFIAAGDLIVMDTLPNGALPDGLVNNHAYMFESVSGSGASATVHLANPWGFDQPAPVLLSQLSRGFVEVDVGHLA
jgi:Calpain family cysteine protease